MSDPHNEGAPMNTPHTPEWTPEAALTRFLNNDTIAYDDTLLFAWLKRARAIEEALRAVLANHRRHMEEQMPSESQIYDPEYKSPLQRANEALHLPGATP